jgi:CBS domain-containing protein
MIFFLSAYQLFLSLHVISFVKHMNPFEKYFDVDKTLKVQSILDKKNKSEQVISANATLMEIIFEMTVKNKEFLYVLSSDKKLRGVLDRYSIIDKIILAR